jgi:phosphoribosylformimino-5-aminoimidazole carboxamide ribotide isomerase
VDIVPVIDVKAGVVVQARGGDRAHYAPIASPLCGSSAPRTVARILSEYCASSCLYLADLDALQGGAAQTDLVRTLLDDDPQRRLWVDAGFTDAASVRRWQQALGAAAGRVRPVLASEALADPATVRSCLDAQPDALLSLDRRGDERWDRAGCWEDPSLWPADVIVMTLERVGRDGGPDVDTIAALRRRSPATGFIGAGGLRDEADRRRATTTGARAWLVASALHRRTLGPVR